MPRTWELFSTDVLGYVAPFNPTNEAYVATRMIEKWLSQGYTPHQIALKWNAGSPVERSGINKYGVPYNSGAYAQKVLATLKR
jgi:hypothetical protein